MPLVIKSQDDDKKSPHLALCHEAQGFSANNRHVSLLMKSDVELTEEITKALEVLGLTSEDVKLNKAFYSQIRMKLQTAVKEKYGDDKEWLYVEDFNDSVVIFCNDKGAFSVEYSFVNGEVTVGDLANPVVSVLTYEPTSGKMLLSEDAEDKLEEGVYSLVTKALQNEETQKHLIEMWKAKEQEVLILQEEIQKAVEAAELVLKAQLKEKEEQLEKALADVVAYESEKKEAIAKARKEKLAAVVSSEEVEGLYKSLEALADEAFEVVVKSFEAKAKVEKESDLFMEKGVSGEGEPVKQEEAGLKLVGDLINKSKKTK